MCVWMMKWTGKEKVKNLNKYGTINSWVKCVYRWKVASWMGMSNDEEKKATIIDINDTFHPPHFLTTIWNSKSFFCWAHKNCLEIMSFNVGFPDLPPLVYLQKCVFSFSSGTFGAAAIAADATNTKHKLCLFHIVSIWYTWMCVLPTQKFVFDKAYYLKHSSELHTFLLRILYMHFWENWLRIDDKKKYKQHG